MSKSMKEFFYRFHVTELCLDFTNTGKINENKWKVWGALEEKKALPSYQKVSEGECEKRFCTLTFFGRTADKVYRTLLDGMDSRLFSLFFVSSCTFTSLVEFPFFFKEDEENSFQELKTLEKTSVLEVVENRYLLKKKEQDFTITFLYENHQLKLTILIPEVGPFWSRVQNLSKEEGNLKEFVGNFFEEKLQTILTTLPECKLVNCFPFLKKEKEDTLSAVKEEVEEKSLVEKSLIPGYSSEDIRVDALTISFTSFSEMETYGLYLLSSDVITKNQLDQAKNPYGNRRYACLSFYHLASSKLFDFLLENSQLEWFQTGVASISRIDFRVSSATTYQEDYLDVFTGFKKANPSSKLFLREKKLTNSFGSSTRNATYFLRIYQDTRGETEKMVFELEFKKNMRWLNDELRKSQSKESLKEKILIFLLKKSVEFYNLFQKTPLLAHFEKKFLDIASYCLSLQEKSSEPLGFSLVTIQKELANLPEKKVPLIPLEIYESFKVEENNALKEKISLILTYFWFSFFSYWKRKKMTEIDLKFLSKPDYWEHTISFKDFYQTTGFRQSSQSSKDLEELVRYLGNLRAFYEYEEKKYTLSIFPMLVTDTKKKELKFYFHPLLLTILQKGILVQEDLLSCYRVFLKEYKTKKAPEKKIRLKNLYIPELFKIITFQLSDDSTLLVKDLEFSTRLRNDSVLGPMVDFVNSFFPSPKQLVYDFKAGKIVKF